MSVSILGKALLCLALAGGAAPLRSAEVSIAKPAVTRPQITSLVIALEDGRSYALSAQELAAAKGGAIFWGDWAVANLLVPHYTFRPKGPTTALSVVRLWFTPGPSGELPAFLVCTPDGPVYPLDPGGPAHDSWIFPSSPRPRIARITVGYGDGRVFALKELALRDGKSGVMLWNDYAIANLLIPFYRSAPHLPTSPEDAMQFWNKPVAAPGINAVNGVMEELPGYTVKPECIPSYPVADPVQ
jgi:hypothetical protein